jgi:hypothetical protein
MNNKKIKIKPGDLTKNLKKGSIRKNSIKNVAKESVKGSDHLIETSIILEDDSKFLFEEEENMLNSEDQSLEEFKKMFEKEESKENKEKEKKELKKESQNTKRNYITKKFKSKIILSIKY